MATKKVNNSQQLKELAEQIEATVANAQTVGAVILLQYGDQTELILSLTPKDGVLTIDEEGNYQFIENLETKAIKKRGRRSITLMASIADISARLSLDMKEIAGNIARKCGLKIIKNETKIRPINGKEK